MQNWALFVLRLTVGALLAGHGSQKLFGWFEGPGLEGFTGAMERMSLRPARPWALLAGLGEFGGGVLTALGLLNPLGPLGIAGAMAMAVRKGHWGKPIWASKGGAELALTNLAAATAVALAGPGDLSLDHVLGIRLPRWMLLPGFAGVAAVVGYGVWRSSRPQPEPAPVLVQGAGGPTVVPTAPAAPAADAEQDTTRAPGAPPQGTAEARPAT